MAEGVTRGSVCWADLLPPFGRRPVLVVTRASAIAYLDSVVVAPVTRTIRGIRSEVRLGDAHGLGAPSVASCDNLFTVRRAGLDEPVGNLAAGEHATLDDALVFALGIDLTPGAVRARRQRRSRPS